MSDARLLRFRTGRINAAGGKPHTPLTTTIQAVAACQLECTSITCGDNAIFNINRWTTGADPESTTFTKGGSANHNFRFPTGHVEMVADGYDRVEVLSAYYTFNIRYIGTSNAAKDFVFAYSFAKDVNTLITHTAGDPGVDNWLDMANSRG